MADNLLMPEGSDPYYGQRYMPSQSLYAYQPTIRERLANWFLGDTPRDPKMFSNKLMQGLVGSTGLPGSGINLGVADAVPGLGQAMGVQEGYRSGDDRNIAMALIPGAPKVAGAVENAAAKGIRAYHGSPHVINEFDRPAYFTTDKNYAQSYGPNLHEVTITPKNPYYTNNRKFIENLDFMKESADLLRSKGHDAAILSGAKDKIEPFMKFDELVEPQIYALDPSIVSKSPSGIRAFHGSPHDFDKFDISKIGTGEGAQAYGHGLYFAEAEDVARSYRDQLGGFKFFVGDQPFNDKDPTHFAAQAIHYAGGREGALKSLAPRKSMFSDKLLDDPLSAEARRIIESGKPIPEYAVPPQGKMYEVRINAHPDDFLDWDKPLSAQSEKVRGALTNSGLAKKDWLGRTKEMSADEIQALAKRRPSDADLKNAADHIAAGGSLDDMWGSPSLALRDAGIPGIKYLDQGSRAAGEGSRNYVVFDADIISIVKKYGIAAATSLYGLDAVNQAMGAAQDQPQNLLMQGY